MSNDFIEYMKARGYRFEWWNFYEVIWIILAMAAAPFAICLGLILRGLIRKS